MKQKLTFNPLTENDFVEIVQAFKKIGWNKPASIYQAYLSEQTADTRTVIIARIDGHFCGYVTLKWQSSYPAFNDSHIPEISDLNVLPSYRNNGIGTKLIAECQKMAKQRDYKEIGLGVGLTSDYGKAQRLYAQLGFIPDGKGLHYDNRCILHGEQVMVDDNLLLYLTKKL